MLESDQLEKTEPFQLKLLPSREVQESLLNCVEEGTKIVTSFVDGSLSEGQSRNHLLQLKRYN
jgi:hypothetical protein